MSWRNIIFTFFSNLFKLMGTSTYARYLIADDAERKRVDVTLNICCNIATGTYLIWLAD